VRFALVDQAKEEFPVQRLCDVLGVSQSGYFAWKSRPASERQHLDMVLLAHVRSSFALSNGPLIAVHCQPLFDHLRCIRRGPSGWHVLWISSPPERPPQSLAQAGCLSTAAAPDRRHRRDTV